MNQLLIFVFLVTLLILTGCNKCGKNVISGNHNLMSGIKADWFPYVDKDNMTFANSTGKIIKLKNEYRDEVMDYHPFREIVIKLHY